MVQFDHHTAATMPPSGASSITSPEHARRRTGWIIGVTLAALVVLIVVGLFAIDVF